jgi:dTDP-4-dehydrorhamnose 3,5-epimerase
MFGPTAFGGVLIIDLERHDDMRGFLARVGCADEFAKVGMDEPFPQANLSHNTYRGTVRGMHDAVAPAAESTVVRCVDGAICDVVVDVSATFADIWAPCISTRLAHEFHTVVNDIDVLYQMGDVFRPEYSHGFRWDDPLLAVQWPFEPLVISDRDLRTRANFA